MNVLFNLLLLFGVSCSPKDSAKTKLTDKEKEELLRSQESMKEIENILNKFVTDNDFKQYKNILFLEGSKTSIFFNIFNCLAQKVEAIGNMMQNNQHEEVDSFIFKSCFDVKLTQHLKNNSSTFLLEYVPEGDRKTEELIFSSKLIDDLYTYATKNSIKISEELYNLFMQIHTLINHAIEHN